MRILFLTQLLPLPLDAGPRIRAYYVLRYLAEAGHEIRLLSFVRQGESNQGARSLQRMCSSVETLTLARSRMKNLRDGFQSLFTTTPFLILRDQVTSMQRKIEQIAANRSFDALHIDQLWMAPYGLRCPSTCLKVLDQHNAVFLIPRRLAENQGNRFAKALLRSEASKLEKFERSTCQRFDRVVWVTEEDRKAVLSSEAGRSPRNCVIPIATDPSKQKTVRRPQPFRVTFVGGMHWPPNQEGISWFAEKVWPKVARRVPSAVLTLIGKGGSAGLQRHGHGLEVEVTGYVADLRSYLTETAVFVVPIRSGAGMRVKILDAWCWGIPVVSTTLGAEGLRTMSGENLLLADDEETFAEYVIKVFQDRCIADSLSRNGRATVEGFYDWRKVYTAWDQIYLKEGSSSHAAVNAGKPFCDLQFSSTI